MASTATPKRPASNFINKPCTWRCKSATGKHSTRGIVRVMTGAVFIAAHALDADTCRHVQASMDKGLCQPAEVLDDTFEVEVQARRATEVDVVDEVIATVESCFDAHRDAIAAFFSRRLAGREGAGFLRYEPGGFYAPHVDRADVLSWPGAARRQITVVMFLNSSLDADPDGDFSGGSLRLYGNDAGAEACDIAPRRGTLVAFPAAMRHEVMAVAGGRRDSVVDWFY